MGANRDDDGRYSPTTDEEEILAAVETHAPAATSEIAAEVGLTRQAVDYRLRQLRENRAVASKQIGASLVWYLVDDTDTSAGEAASATPDATDTPTADRPPETLDKAMPPTLEAHVARLDLEGSGRTLEARRAALVEILEHLRDEGSATAAELKALVDDEDERLYADANSFWRNMSRQGVFAELEVVEKPGRGGKRYYYADPDEK